MAEITDVIVQDINGIPYFAGCFGSDYCKNNADHVLLSGFFSAINSFKVEFSQEYLRTVGFDKLQLVIETENPIMVIFAAETDYDPMELRKFAKEILFNFISIHNDNPDSDDFNDPVINETFSTWLNERLDKPTMSIKPLLKKKRKGWLGRIKAFLI